MANFGSRAYFDACVYTSTAGREQLRVAAIVVAKAVLGYDSDPGRRSQALTYQSLLATSPGALDLCNNVREVWMLGTTSRDDGVTEMTGPMAQLEAVAENVYRGRSNGFPWGLTFVTVALAGSGLWYWNRRRKQLPAGR